MRIRARSVLEEAAAGTDASNPADNLEPVMTFSEASSSSSSAWIKFLLVLYLGRSVKRWPSDIVGGNIYSFIHSHLVCLHAQGDTKHRVHGPLNEYNHPSMAFSNLAASIILSKPNQDDLYQT